MSGHELLLRWAARMLPGYWRATRLEEWQADLAHSAELGVHPSEVSRAAWRFALTVGVRAHVGDRRARRRALAAGGALLAVVLVATPAAAIAAAAFDNARGVVTVETLPDGTQREVFWRDYPGIAGVDPTDILAGPSAEQGWDDGAALIAEIRTALTAEFGLDWASPREGDVGVRQRTSNRYGGLSMLDVLNGPGSQSLGVPTGWPQKARVLEIIGEITARHGYGPLVLDHDRAWADDRSNIDSYGGATPAASAIVSGLIEGPSGQWLMFAIQDLRLDTDGHITERFEGSIEHGWQPNTVTLGYGANALLPENDRAEFQRRLAPFAGFEQPAPRPSD